MPVALDMRGAWTDTEARIYDRLIAPAILAFQDPLLRALADRLPGGARVLDVGCGGGQVALALARHRPDLAVWGLDLNRYQVTVATERARAAGARAHFVRGTALALPFADAAFDAVYSVASIKHWPDRVVGLRECLRVARPGAFVSVVEIDRHAASADIERFVSHWPLPRPLQRVAAQYVRHFVARHSLPGAQLEHLARLAGGADVERRRIEGLPAAWVHMRRAR